jgi:PRTRC genetic system protein C
MALQVQGDRIFEFKKDGKIERLADPNPAMAPERVMEFYSNHYPELINGNVEGPTLGKDDEIIYTLSFTVKTKG